MAILIAGSVQAQSVRPNRELRLGKKVYEANCTSCHGVTGDGKGPAARAIASTKPRNFLEEDFRFGATPKEVLKTVSEGIPGSAMPPWKDALSLKEREAVIQYILSLKKITRR